MDIRLVTGGFPGLSPEIDCVVDLETADIFSLPSALARKSAGAQAEDLDSVLAHVRQAAIQAGRDVHTFKRNDVVFQDKHVGARRKLCYGAETAINAGICRTSTIGHARSLCQLFILLTHRVEIDKEFRCQLRQPRLTVQFQRSLDCLMRAVAQHAYGKER